MHGRTLLLLMAVPVGVWACAPTDEAGTTADSAPGVAATAASDVGAVRQAIETANTQFVDAMKRGDTAAIGTNYASDAVVMAPGAESWRGPDAIRKGFGGWIADMPVKDATLRTDDVAVAGDMAVESGTYEMTMQPRTGAEVKDKGKYLVVWKRQPDGSWKISKDIFNSDMPPKG